MSKQDTYRERAKHAFNFKKNTVEALARTAGVTLLTSFALTGLTDKPSADKYPAGPITTLGDKAPGHEDIKQLSPTQLSLAKVASFNALESSKPISLSQDYAGSFKANKLSSEQKEELDELVENIDEATSSDPSLKVTIDIRGFASDESQADSKSGDANLGEPSAKNLALAVQRAEVTRAYLTQQLDNSEQVFTVTSGKENVLTKSQISDIDQLAAGQSLSRQELLRQYNNDELELSKSKSKQLQSLLDRTTTIKTTLDHERDVTTEDSLSSKSEYTDQSQETIAVATPGRRGIDIYPFLIPPFPRLPQLRNLRDLISRRRKTKEHTASYGYGYGYERKVSLFEKFWGVPASSLLPQKTYKADHEKLSYRIPKALKSAPGTVASFRPTNIEVVKEDHHFIDTRQWYDYILRTNGPPRKWNIRRKIR